jgi:hypothetical protein
MDRVSVNDRAMRAGDSDRNDVIGVLGDAFADGRLDYEEFHHRHDRAASARTLGELRDLVRDLPGTLASETELVVTAGLQAQRRSGAWDVPARLVVTAAIAEVRLDFRHAVCPHREVLVEVRPGLGRVRLLVPYGWGVRTDQLRAGWGSIRCDHLPDPVGDQPVLVLVGLVGVGRVVVRRPLFSRR